MKTSLRQAISLENLKKRFTKLSKKTGSSLQCVTGVWVKPWQLLCNWYTTLCFAIRKNLNMLTSLQPTVKLKELLGSIWLSIHDHLEPQSERQSSESTLWEDVSHSMVLIVLIPFVVFTLMVASLMKLVMSILLYLTRL